MSRLTYTQPKYVVSSLVLLVQCYVACAVGYAPNPVMRAMAALVGIVAGGIALSHAMGGEGFFESELARMGAGCVLATLIGAMQLGVFYALMGPTPDKAIPSTVAVLALTMVLAGMPSFSIPFSSSNQETLA